jgi:putative endonuclease
VNGQSPPAGRPGGPGRPGRSDQGARAEELAAAYLAERGFRVLARNWRRPEGELDLVALDGETCVFVEVRSRTGEEFGHPLEAVTARKRAQVIRAARLFLDSEPVKADAFRFDVVGVLFTEGDAEPPICTHIADAFRVGE